MNRDNFWAMVDDARSGRDSHDQVEAIRAELVDRSSDEIVDFDRHMSELLANSYSWNLWGAAYLIKGGCSDDGFDYFRGWLIAQGQSVYDNAIANPDSLADVPALEEDVECSELLSIAWSAYESVAKAEMPMNPINLPDLGEGWDFDDDAEMKQRYPKLFARFRDT
jgi:hypothetical protein